MLKKLLQGYSLLPCPTGSGKLGRIIPVPLPAPGPSTSPHFESEKETQDTLWSNQESVNPESDLTSHYLLLRRWGSSSVGHPKPTGSGRLQGEKATEQLSSGMVLF